MPTEKIRLTVEGLSVDEGHVRLRDFLQELDSLRQALRTTDRLISGEAKPTLYYRIVGLSHSSPATVELEPVCTNPAVDTRNPILSGFLKTLYAIKQESPIPPWVTSDLLQHLEKVAKPVGKTVHSAHVSGNGSDIDLDRDFQIKLERLLSLEEQALGSVEGRLEKINVHLGANIFEIYPSIGPNSIKCHFPASLEHTAIHSVKCWVTVTGKLTYKRPDEYPSKVDVASMDVHPAIEDLPSLSDLKGVAPRATGRYKSETFVRRLRDEWQ